MAIQPKPIFLATDVELQTLPDGGGVVHWAARESWQAALEVWSKKGPGGN
ncbi:MAG: hypothetical protein H6747_15470 [Deltaproteobacteria bacterium]|nr:hypothetical protein [Deltaproteobacteria bacterium]